MILVKMIFWKSNSGFGLYLNVWKKHYSIFSNVPSFYKTNGPSKWVNFERDKSSDTCLRNMKKTYIFYLCSGVWVIILGTFQLFCCAFKVNRILGLWYLVLLAVWSITSKSKLSIKQIVNELNRFRKRQTINITFAKLRSWKLTST